MEGVLFMTKVDIYSGFLGAGKTTLIKKMIAEGYKGQKLVLIENEFGEIGIDGGFLKEAGINITEMNSGCICCSLVGDFGKALTKVINEYHPDRIIIEPSGVGKLSDVIGAVNKVTGTDVTLGYTVAVADAGKVKVYTKNFGEFYNNQVETASTIILSRTDSIPQAKLDAAVELLRSHNQVATIITTPWSQLTGEQLVAAMEGKASLAAELARLETERLEAEDEEHEHHHHHHHDEDEEEHHHHHHDEDDEDEEHEHHHHHDHDGDCCCHDHEEHEHHHHHDHDDHDDDCGCGCHDHHEHHDHEHHHDHDHGHHHHDHEHDHDHEEHENHDHEHHHDHDHEEHKHHHEHDHEEHEHHHDHDHEGHDHHHHHHADEVFTSWGVETAKKFEKATIEAALKGLDSGDYGMILRAKGILPCVDGTWIHFDYVPEEHDIRTGSADVTGKLCVIGSKLDENGIQQLFGV